VRGSNLSQGRLSCCDVIRGFTQDFQRTTGILTGSCLCILTHVISGVICLFDDTYLELLSVTLSESGFGGLEVACWPLVPKSAGSNPVEAVGFFRAKKSSARLPSEGQ
jgi:hypothetical protein